MQPEYSVYAIRHRETGKYYFGQTTSSIHDRWMAHVAAARGKSTTPISNAIRELGAAAFDLVPMLRGLCRADADEWERLMVERHEDLGAGVFNYMFTRHAAEVSRARKTGLKASPETRAKQSEAHRARWAAMPAETRADLLKRRSAGGVAARQAVHPRMSEEQRREKSRLKAKRARDRRKAQKESAQ